MNFWDLRTATAVCAYVLAAGFLGLFWVLIWKIARDKVDIGSIIMEGSDSASPGKGSISRFQLLVFTMTIAGLYVILCIENGQLIEVPNGTLALLGISAGSFVVSKAVGSKDDGKGKAPRIVTKDT